MNRLIIIGASGHGKVVADIAQLTGYTDIVFVDDNETLSECAGYPVIGTSNEISEGDLFVAIGNCKIRQQIMNRYANRVFPVLIHPNAVISESSTVGRGTVIMAGAIVNPYSTIGEGCIINTCSSVDHDCVIDDYVHVSVGSHICGSVHVGRNTWIGTGTIVSNNISICDNCMIGAGSVVVKDIDQTGTYYGVPAKRHG